MLMTQEWTHRHIERMNLEGQHGIHFSPIHCHTSGLFNLYAVPDNTAES